MININYDFAGRVSQVIGTFGTQITNYVASAQYAPHGAPMQYSYGNTLYRNYTYNSRLQPLTATDTVQNNTGNTHLSLAWNWGTSNNNGNLQSLTANHGGPLYPVFLTLKDYYLYDGVKPADGRGGLRRE